MGLNNLNDNIKLDENNCRLVNTNKSENQTKTRCTYTLLVSEDVRLQFGKMVQLGLYKCKVDDPSKAPTCYGCYSEDHMIKD